MFRIIILMKDSGNSKFSHFLSGKFLTIAGAIALCAVIVSAVITNYTEKKLSQILPGTQYSEIEDETDYTSPAEVNKTDVPDERTSAPETTEAETTGKATQTTEKKTTVKATEAETEYKPVNSSFCLPCDGEIMKTYSADAPLYSKTMSDWRTHPGIDIKAAEGDKIHSVGNGKVVKVSSDPMWGYTVEINYGSFIGRYCSLKQGTVVSIDDTVEIGDVIGELGTVPVECEDEPHLHFEAVKDGKTIDPMLVLPQ